MPVVSLFACEPPPAKMLLLVNLDRSRPIPLAPPRVTSAEATGERQGFSVHLVEAGDDTP